ncbi:MAG TPA: AAA family ATPase, partial [Polyangiaceae bacterium]
MRLPEELLGRHSVRAALSDALLESSNGTPSLVLLTGDGGSGKSTVLLDLKRAAHASGAVVLVSGWGLFDRDIPFRGLFPLCEQLVEWLSTLPEVERQTRIATLRASLADSCGVVTEAFPMLESVLGIHARPPATSTIERQNRLTYCFTTLLAALGTAGRPVVVLLEDLHWADGASLFIVERLPGQAGGCHLLTVATVRTGPDGADENFLSRLEQTSAERGQTVRKLFVSPFELGDTESFLAGALCMLPAATTTLASVLTEMSLGNPLAVRELLAEIQAQGLLAFERETGHWVWHTDTIRQSHIPEDVAQLFASRISSLPAEALEALRAAACVGGRFDSCTIAPLLAKPSSEIDGALATCAQAGFIVPRAPAAASQRGDQVFEFRHERIQKATYTATPTAMQRRVHAARGAALLAEHDTTHASDTLFEALTHLNRDHALREGKEDIALAKLNFLGALRAKEATAYDTAAQLLQNVRAQLPIDGQSWDPNLAFDYALIRAECEHLCKRTSIAAEIYADLLKRVSGPEQRITVLMARTQMLTNVGRFAET